MLWLLFIMVKMLYTKGKRFYDVGDRIGWEDMLILGLVSFKWG